MGNLNIYIIVSYISVVNQFWVIKKRDLPV